MPTIIAQFNGPRRRPKRSHTFGVTLRQIRDALRLTQPELGARLGVSQRTITRWEVHGDLPPLGQRKHLATSFPDVPHALRAALARSLELDEAFVAGHAAPPAPAPVAQAPSPGALDGAFLELAERIGVAPGPLRAALVDFLRRAEAMGLTVQATRGLMEPKAAGSKRSGRAG